ncbi:unnamed protein product [Prorocentrum cordatum]|uniref:PS II complex 12 kDa extrinsic protein n=1 Tax=Prorocentrum cordatum TaxID=2364126 RepID=A0ABN9TU43_9DINO|nr:unnamed protein product [Polarella glacialis]
MSKGEVPVKALAAIGGTAVAALVLKKYYDSQQGNFLVKEIPFGEVSPAILQAIKKARAEHKMKMESPSTAARGRCTWHTSSRRRCALRPLGRAWRASTLCRCRDNRAAEA